MKRIGIVFIAMFLACGGTRGLILDEEIFESDSFDPLAPSDGHGVLHQMPPVRATDFDRRYRWRWVYYFKANEQLMVQPAYVGALQRDLKRLGYYCGPIDRTLSDEVSDAIARLPEKLFDAGDRHANRYGAASVAFALTRLRMSAAVNKSIIDLLMAGGVAWSEEAAQLAQNLNGGSWTMQVLDSGKVDEQRFLTAIGNFFRVPVVALDAKAIDRQTLSILPPRFVFQHHILPIEEKWNSVVLATYDLFNSAGRQLVTQLLKKPAEWVLVPRTQLLRAMKTLYGVGAETFDEILKTNRGFEVLQEGETATDISADDPEASVVKFVNQIIREAIAERATDIHVEPLENDIRIRYRIDGILHEVAVPPQLRVLHAAIISRLKVMSHMDIAERRLPQDGRMNLHAANQEIDVRVSTIPTVNGESISLRLLARGGQQFGFQRLDLSQEQETVIRHIPGPAQWNHPAHRPDRVRKIDIALLLPQHHQLGLAPHYHDRGTG